MTKHTQTPYIFAPTGIVMAEEYKQPFILAQREKANLIAGIFGDVEGGEEVAKANAEFIVRACNSHYDLLEALKGLWFEAERRGDFPKECIECARKVLQQEWLRHGI